MTKDCNLMTKVCVKPFEINKKKKKKRKEKENYIPFLSVGFSFNLRGIHEAVGSC